MRFRTQAALAVLLLIACADDEPALPAEPAPEALFAGCDEFSGSVCTLERRSRLTVWLDVHGATPLIVRIDGQSIPSTGRVVQGGVRLEFEVPAGASAIEVETTEASWEPPVELGVTWEEVPPDLAKRSTTELEVLAKEGTGWVQLRTLDILRRRLQESERGPAFRIQELALARKLGARHHEVWALASEAHTLIERGDLVGALSVVEQLGELSQTSRLAEARWYYFRGLLAYQSGDFGVALTHLQRAHVLSERLDYGLGYVLEVEAATLAELGRESEATVLVAERLHSLERESRGCAARVRIMNNIAWVQIQLASNDRDHEDPRPILEDALDLDRTCSASSLEGYLKLNLALIELTYGNPREALEWLATIGNQDSGLRAWVDEVQARAAADCERQADLPSLLLHPVPTRDPALTWNQNVRIADGLAAWGFDDLAAREYREAEAQLAENFERVGSGGEFYLSGRSASLDGLVSVLVGQGHVEEASCAIRLARARELGRLDRVSRLQAASPEEHEAWQKKLSELSRDQSQLADARAERWNLSVPEREKAASKALMLERSVRRDLDDALRGIGLEPTPRRCDELRPPSDGEVILTTYSSEERWLFATSAAGVEFARGEELAQLESLGSATLISVIEAGQGPAAPLHSSRWRDQASLIDIAPVAYSLDLRARVPNSEPRRSALLVADTRGDLPSAAKEADAVAAALESGQWDVVQLMGSGATRDALLEHTSNTDLLHYAGHGVQQGVAGWESALLLANDERLEVTDILTLARAPRGVVLMGCDTDAASPDTVGGGVTIGRAFVLSGSEWVIAADTEVEDRYASQVGIRVHQSAADDGPTKLRDALLQLRGEDPEGPWEHFRVIVP